MSSVPIGKYGPARHALETQVMNSTPSPLQHELLSAAVVRVHPSYIFILPAFACCVVYRKPSFFFKENSGFFSLALFCFIKRRYMLYATIKAPLQFLNLKPTASMTPPNLQTAQLASTALTFCHDDISLWAS